MLSTIQIYLIATTLQALLTGTHFATFLLCLRWLIFSDDGGTLCKPINQPFLIITAILFALSVITLGLCLQRISDFTRGAMYATASVLYIEVADVSNLRIELLVR